MNTHPIVADTRLPLPSGQTVTLMPPALRLRDPVSHQPGPTVLGTLSPVRIDTREESLATDAWCRRVVLHNDSDKPVLVDVFAALLRDLAARSATLYLPHMGGAVLPIDGANYESHSFGQLTLAAMIVHLGDEGLVLSQEKTAEAEELYRTGILAHGEGLPSGALAHKESTAVGSAVDSRHDSAAALNLGGIACFTENVWLPARGTVELGPYVMATYRGPWTAGAARLRALRRPRPMRPWPAWFQPVRSVSEALARQVESFEQLPNVASDIASWGARVFHLWEWWNRTEEIEQPKRPGRVWDYGVNPWWAYAFDQPGADPRKGGDEALRAGIREIRRQGSRLLLYVTPWTLAVDSAAGRRALERRLHIREPDGKERLEAESVRLCPMVPEARQWIVDAFLRVLQRYDADGLFIDQTAAIGNTVCVNPAHDHGNPYVWSGGIRQLFRELRARLDVERPGTVLLLEGASELLREYADGYLCHSHSWTGMRHTAPVTRALNHTLGIFDSFCGYTFDAPPETHDYCRKAGMQPRTVEYMAAIQFAGGIYYYTDQSGIEHKRHIYKRHQPLRLAYPEMIDGEMRPELPQFDPPTVTGYLFESAGHIVLTLADLGGGDCTAGRVKVRLPFGRALFDRLTSTHYPIENQMAVVPLDPLGVNALEVV